MGVQSLKWKLLPNMVLFLNIIWNLQQLIIFFNDFFNLVLVCKVIGTRYWRTRTRGFFSIVRIVSLTFFCWLETFICYIYSTYYYKHRVVQLSLACL